MNRVLTAENFKTSNWSGGKTKELFIYPLNSEFKKLDFDVRLSTATVEVEESVFTPLPGVDRTLMVIEGETELSHENSYIKKLKQFDQDSFNGSCKTTSKGHSTNFNLMLRNNLKGEVSSVKLNNGQHETFSFFKSDIYVLVYPLCGTLVVNIKTERFNLESGNLLVLDSATKADFKSDSYCQFIIVRVNKEG